jgi:acetyl esterase
MRKRHVVAALAVVALGGVAGLTYRWTFTPHGRLDWRAALSLNLLTFEYTFRPDPNHDLELTLPINLLYPMSMALPVEAVRGVEDLTIPAGERSIPARVYRPESVASDDTRPPVIVYYHGGGFVTGSVEIFDALARSLSNATSSIVVSVDYRLAPVHPYPAAVEDAYAAFEWVAENAAKLEADPEELFVGGDSAGGNLAAVVSLRATDAGGPAIAGQLLYYPGTDYCGDEYDSGRNFADGYGLSRGGSGAFRRAYAGRVKDKRDPYLSPLHAKSHAGLPPAFVVTAGFDPLTDSAEAYVARLRDAGVPVTHVHYPEMVHGFMSIRFFPQRRAALMRTGRFLRALLEPDGRAPGYADAEEGDAAGPVPIHAAVKDWLHRPVRGTAARRGAHP